MRRSVVEQHEKDGALPAFHRLSWEGAGWLSRLWWVPILALAMALRFYHLTSAAIWGDEGSSLLLSEYALADAPAAPARLIGRFRRQCRAGASLSLACLAPGFCGSDQ